MIDCKTTGFYQGLTILPQYPSHCISDLFQGGCLASKNPPLALVVSSTRDENGALSFTHESNRNLLATLAKTHTVCHRYIQDSLELNDLIERLGHQKKIDVLVMRAHGTPLLQSYGKELMSPYSPRSHFVALNSSLTPDATIILNSCSNAATCGEDDFAGFIHSMAPSGATVYAATREIHCILIESGTPPKVELFHFDDETWDLTDVTFKSGADGYCNNPRMSAPEDLHKQKLNNRLNLLRSLVDRGESYEAAISTASEAIESTDREIRINGFLLFERLFDKAQGYEAAIRVGIKNLKSTNDKIRITGILLLERVVDRGYGYEAAASAVIEAFKSTNEKLRYRAIILSEKLKDQGYEVANRCSRRGFQK